MQNLKDDKSAPVAVRPLREADLTEARLIFHLAFGTFLGLSEPMRFCAGRDFFRGRYFANPEGFLGAEAHGMLIGSNIASHWGSVGFLGPLAIHPDFWDRGVARKLLEPTVQLFDRWHTRHAGLFTFPHSTKHVHLYQKFGFAPRFLTAVMSKTVRPPASSLDGELYYSGLTPARQSECLKASLELSDAIYEGLDLRGEIRAVAEQKLGEVIFLWNGSQLMAFAICHCGAETEAGELTCYVKFGAARHAKGLEQLLSACEALAVRRGLTRIEAGVSTAREEAYRRMQARGFRTDVLGVAMHRPNEAGYSRPEAFVLDDWR
ncbi:MAG TPA: GNAT family N-acetyltransferase [Verrucomicrobiae bacterium]|nr:GNAT family N-acetyltransferase [Verrucomicrobiae bacterium]